MIHRLDRHLILLFGSKFKARISGGKRISRKTEALIPESKITPRR
jgi:hypothetical protein